MEEMLTVDELFIVSEILLVLKSSDIVWTKYGTETMEELALRIYKTVKKANHVASHSTSLD